jgi:hypothetical protein
MSRFRSSARIIVTAAAFVSAPLLASAQEFGVYAGAGVGGIRDVRRPFGGGLSAALFRDWIGVRGDLGQYWTVEHRLGLVCVGSNVETKTCTSTRLSSHSQFPMIDGALMVRGRIPGKGIRFEGGAGPSWVRVTNEIRTEKDDPYSPRLTSSRSGFVLLAGVMGTPQWRVPISVELLYAYHKTGAFGSCTNEPNDPICGQRLHFHETRLAVLYRPKVVRR